MDQFREIFLASLGGPLSKRLDVETTEAISYSMDLYPVQDSFRMRAKHYGLKVALSLIDEKGELRRETLREWIDLLRRESFILGPGRENDAEIFAHLKKCLELLETSEEIWEALRRSSAPVCHKWAEVLIRETLWPESLRQVTTAHVRRAVLAAWLTFLRQMAGSCFATAPAILVQQTEPLQFFKDICDLLSIGQMKRVLDGKEYSVPLSFSMGSGDLQRVVAAPFFGLAAALEAGGASFTQERQRAMMESEPKSVAVWLKTFLLEEVGLTEEDLRDEEHLSKIQMTPLLAKQGAVYYQRPSERGQKASDWKKRFEKASTVLRTVSECPLLRAWEFSIASFSDVKIEFARWNLFIGLGLHPDEKDGIGEFLYAHVNGLLQKCYLEMDLLEKEYEQELGAMRALEVMLENAMGETRRHQIQSEWITRNTQSNAIAEMREKNGEKAKSLVGFFSWLIERYDEKMREFFQELFDPSLQIDVGIYDDSPAGFRLVYKHGRSDASQWSAIQTEEEYISALRDFFSQMEREFEVPQILGKELFEEITTALVQFIQGDAFIQGALARAKGRGRLSPWHYISGGTLEELLMVYCNRARPFKEVKIVPHSPHELLQFFASLNRVGPLLVHSPTHAFLAYPERLEGKTVLYSLPKQEWNEKMQEHLIHRFSLRLAQSERGLFIHRMRQSGAVDSHASLKERCLQAMSAQVKMKEALIDSFLYENEFLLNPTEGKEALLKILSSLGSFNLKEPIDLPFWGPLDLYNGAKRAILQSSMNAISEIDWDAKIAKVMRSLKLLPDALLFADTNWSGWFFGFVQNPLSAQLELWRLNRTATIGSPMIEWKEWMGPQTSSPWVLFPERIEYSF